MLVWLARIQRESKMLYLLVSRSEKVASCYKTINNEGDIKP